MELSLAVNSHGLISGSQSAVPAAELKSSIVFFPRRRECSRGYLKFEVKASLRPFHPESIPSNKDLSRESSGIKTETLNKVRLFVGLPLDAVSETQTLNHARAIAAGLKALKLLGVEGVELPVWWGIVEKEAMGKYDWSGYQTLAEMVRDAGLKLHITLCFHANPALKIKLPDWITRIGETQPDIYFKDRTGRLYKDCLSLAVDDLPLLDRKTPCQVYHDFCESFKSSFASFMDTTITGITIGLGPDGDLRYPSHHKQGKEGKIPGAGEFQCYDKHMLSLLKQQAEGAGNPLWGLGGPHDAPTYDQHPNSTNFFKDGGSWESPYGSFFLSWYSGELLSHGDRLLSMASSLFKDCSIPIYGGIPLMHSWYNTRSHASELTAGFFNAESRDAYEKVAETFAKHGCKMIIPGMDLRDEDQREGSFASPERLVAQIRSACRDHGVEVAGENASLSTSGLEKIGSSLTGEMARGVFLYNRMGAEFFSPEHFPAFTQFVRCINQPGMHADDLPEREEEGAVSSVTSAEMQVA